MVHVNLADDVVAELDRALSEYIAGLNGTLEEITRLRTNRLTEACRRRLEGLTLRSTYNNDRIKALAKTATELRAELAPLLKTVAIKRLLLDIAEGDLSEYRDAEARLQQERAVRHEIGIYAEPARLIDILYDEHGIDRGDFASLNSEDIARIAAIFKARSAPLRTAEPRAAVATKTAL